MRVRLIAAFAAAMMAALPAGAWAQGICRAAIAGVERMTGVPDRLMQAVAVVESGRRDAAGNVAAWPWTINVEGVGAWFETKAEAIAAVNARRAQGARSIDVGCMQVNLMHHADAFASLDDAFDPVINARYAAGFLQRLLAQTGSWPRAVAGYHSLTPDIGGDYARKVLAVWALPEQTRAPNAPVPAVGTVPSAPPAATVAALPSPGRQSQPRAVGPMMTGRSLESYRAIPTRLLAAAVPIARP